MKMGYVVRKEHSPYRRRMLALDPSWMVFFVYRVEL